MGAEHIRFFRSQGSLTHQPAGAGVSTEPDCAGASPHTLQLSTTDTDKISISVQESLNLSDSDLLKGQEISTNSILAFGTSKEGTTPNLIMTTKKNRKSIEALQWQNLPVKRWFPLCFHFFGKTLVFQHHKVLYTFITGTLNKYYLVDLVSFEIKLCSNALFATTENIFSYDWGHSLVVSIEVLG